MTKYQYIEIVPCEQLPGRKTRDYAVLTRRTGDTLGHIMFYPSWRQHVLEPMEGTVWSAGCLADVIDFMGRIKRGEA